MIATGYWFDGGNAHRRDARMSITAFGSYQLIVEGEPARSGQLAELSVSDRLGDMPRRLTWPDDGVFETRDNDTLDNWLAASGHKASRVGLLHSIESSWGWVVTAILVTIVVSYLGIRYAVPAASESIARKLPVNVKESVSRQAMASLDKLVFDESDVAPDERARVQRQFDDLLAQLPDSDVNFKLYFRSMNGIANAMALPGGEVVVTDAFLELVEHPLELESVLLHEIGHVVEYHGLTQVIRASAMSVIVTLAFGDLSALGEVAVGIPVFIMQNSYSQSAETEADSYAFARMREMNKDPKYFADIILRLSGTQLDESQQAGRQTSYFSSHPDSRERAKRAVEASQNP